MSLRGAIGRARKRVEKQGDYIASMEIRTRYTLVDPILQALGWNLEVPSQVKIEHETTNQSNPRRVDYALFSKGKPVIIVEAKMLPREYLDIHKANRKKDNARMRDAWKRIRLGEEIPNAPPTIAIFREMRKDHEDQLKKYVEQLQLGSGYAVLTYGADWSIFDLAKESESIRGKHLAAVNILFDTTDHCVEVLKILRRGRWK